MFPLLVHAELPGPIEAARQETAKSDPRKYKTWLRSRPPAAETKAVEMMIRLAREFKSHVHIVHVSSELSVPLIWRAKKEGVRVTAETCPHYLYFLRRLPSEMAGRNTNARRRFAIRKIIRKLWKALGKGASISSFPITRHRRRR